MAGVKISALPASPGLSGSELVPVVDGGVTMRTTVGAIAALGGGGITLPIQTDGDTVLFELRDSGTPTRTLDVSAITENGPDQYVQWKMEDDLGGKFRYGASDGDGGSVFKVYNQHVIALRANSDPTGFIEITASNSVTIFSADSQLQGKNSISLETSDDGSVISLNSNGVGSLIDIVSSGNIEIAAPVPGGQIVINSQGAGGEVSLAADGFASLNAIGVGGIAAVAADNDDGVVGLSADGFNGAVTISSAGAGGSIQLSGFASINLTASGVGGFVDTTATDHIFFTAPIVAFDCTSMGFFNTPAVVQPAPIADAVGGGVIDAEARTALNSLLAAVRSLGLIDT